MLSWFFKKRQHAGTAAAPAAPKAAAVAGAAQATAPVANANANANANVAAAAPEWAAHLQAARGDDAALLHIAAQGPPLHVKLAAVDALTTEAALRQAEREFRSHDRKVHRLAKLRLEAAVAQREARARAQAMLERVAALVDEADVPINHVVELDRGWESLAADLLEPEQRARFAELRARLDAAIRERGLAQQRLHHWCGDARRLLPEWRRAIAAAAQQGVASDLAPVGRAMRALIDARPAVPATATADLDRALVQALEAAAQVGSRLAWLEAQAVGPAVAPVSQPEDEPEDEPENERVQAASASQAQGRAEGEIDGPMAEGPMVDVAAAPSDPPAGDEIPGPDAAAAVPRPAVPPRWTDLPAATDAELAQILDQRYALWLRERALVSAAPPAKQTPGPRPGHNEAAAAARRQQVESLLQQAEQALAEGQLGAVQQHLQAIDMALGTARAAALPDALRARLQALRAEGARLKGWQQWGGARAREDLVAEAEALARQTQAATDPEASDKPKLNLTQHAQAIQALRQRWKDLDRLSATAPQSLWQRLDESLHTAFAPVAAQQAALKAARQENLAAREVLLAGLEALALPLAAADPAAPSPAEVPPMDWKDVVRELHGFQVAWRKLGPVEHTVPASARQALQQRLRHSVDRIELPLQALRRSAAEMREQLIARARALAPHADPQLPWHEATRQLRELQAAWQQEARQLPLPRPLETDLWARFKAATDAVFAQRDAAAAARDAELSANLAAREALLARLTGLGTETEPAEIERTLAEVDRAWRLPAELPRGAGESLEARFRTAWAAALQSVSAARTRHWQVQCDALATRLALCQAREAADGGTADPGPRWAAQDGLPAAWQRALAWRWDRPPAAGPLAETEVDDLLLQLETVLDLPSAPERQAERRQLKLRALKEAMEGRSPQAPGPGQHSAWWLALLRQGGLTPAQRQRLQALVAALRQAPPGTLARVSTGARASGS